MVVGGGVSSVLAEDCGDAEDDATGTIELALRTESERSPVTTTFSPASFSSCSSFPVTVGILSPTKRASCARPAFHAGRNALRLVSADPMFRAAHRVGDDSG